GCYSSTCVRTFSTAFTYPNSVAVDASGNLFVTDLYENAVEEIEAAGGYTTVKTLLTGDIWPAGIAVDGVGNLFFADSYNDAVKEIPAEGGYATALTLSGGFSDP